MKTRLIGEDLFYLHTLTWFRSYLVKSIRDLKQNVVCVLDQIFPEYQTIFCKASKESFFPVSSPIDFENVSSETLAKLLVQLSSQKLELQKSKC